VLNPKVTTLLKYVGIFFGCAILAFGSAAFIEPLGLINGGVLSVGVIIQHFVTVSGSTFHVVDIVTWGLQIIFFVVGFLFLGKAFAAKTLFASLVYPLLFTLFYRVPFASYASLGEFVASKLIVPNKDSQLAYTLLAGIAGGACSGIGVGLCYFYGGSSGGVDVISLILSRYTRIKESVASFIIDATLIIIGIVVIQDLANGLIGIISAFICALAVEYVYVRTSGSIIADIITSKPDEIISYVIKEMDRSTTVYNATGAYTGVERKVIRVAFSRRQFPEFKAFISKVDPKAFVTFTETSMINGEGFDPLVPPPPQGIAEFKKKKDESNNGEPKI